MRSGFKFIVTVLILFLGVVPRALAAVSITASIDYATMTLEDEAQIQVVVQGGSASDPVAPNVPGLDIVQTGKSSQFSFVNGKMSSNATYIYTVVADDPGQYEIPGFIVYSGGQEIKSNSLKLTISAPQTHAGQNPILVPQNQNQGKANPNDPQVSKIIDQQNAGQALPFWIATNVTKTNPYLSEPILYHFKFFSRVNVNIDQIEMPDFHDFYAEVVVPERKGREEVSGLTYTTYEVVYALSPLKTGALNIDRATLRLSYREQTQNSGGWDPFFGGKVVRKNLTAEAIPVDVRSLPSPKPADFSNLVGQFEVRSEWPKTTLKLGDSVTLTVELAGVGNFKEAAMPPWSVDGVKIYQNKPLIDSHVESDGVHGVATFQVAFVPTEAGEKTIPDLSVSTFDPEQEKYVTHKIQGVTLAVTDDGSLNSSQTVFAQTPVNTAPPNVPLKNINGLFEDGAAAQNFSTRALSPRSFLLCVLALPVLLLLGSGWQAMGPRLFGRGQSKKRMRQSAQALKAALQNQASGSREIYQKTQAFLSQRLGVDVTAKTPQEMTALLGQRFPDRDWQALRVTLEKLEQHSYSLGSVELNAASRQEFLTTLESLWSGL